MSSIIFISFDIRKDDYPSMSYSIAALAASISKENHSYSHYSIDLQHSLEEKLNKESILDIVTKKLQVNINYFQKFDFIAISLTSWTIEYCIAFLQMLYDYQGKVILGGYEVTSRTAENLVSAFPRADYFIKGYAEKALKNILNDNTKYESNVITDQIESSDIISPYLTGILATSSKKIHWETKRGCPYKCGFCEWGNSTNKVVYINPEQLSDEITLFSKSTINEINILDGTFNLGNSYLDIFSRLLDLKDVKITCQAKFEKLLKQDGVKFLELCKKASDRVHLEFGLQTIHKEEMETIGRDNDIIKIEKVLRLLKLNNIDYEVSIIYAIPGQTVESFIDTIEFLITRGCKNIKAYPLSIPKNSVMESQKIDNCIIEGKNKYNVFSVISNNSFPVEQRKDMDNIASRLNNGELFTDFESLPADFNPGSLHQFSKITQYQWNISAVSLSGFDNVFQDRIISDYLSPTMDDIGKEDFRQSTMALGHSLRLKTITDRHEYYNQLLSGKSYLELKKMEFGYSKPDAHTAQLLAGINQNLTPKKYILKFNISLSSNVYVYREIELG
jgi:radical SAM superfamily enzyme YgiQ (UPF0313 family)